MIIALNNKCNLTKNEFIEYQNELSKLKSSSKIILCPTYLNISLFNIENVELGSENVSSTSKGAYTGEICAEQLKSYGVKYSIVGHSERREYQRETLDEINKKIRNLFDNDIIPILCIGETKEERDNNKVEEVLEKELTTAISGLSEEEKDKLIIAYEPIWSIGTGIIPTIEEINEVFEFIKTILNNSKILYGGSANEKNIDILKTSSLIDGYLLGGLSLKPTELQIFINKLENNN